MRLIDLKGKQFGRLTVIKRSENNSKGQARWVCQCVCGNTVVVAAADLKRGTVQSCKCLQSEKISKRMTTHGMTNTPTYKTWLAMHQRCTNPNHDNFALYGGRGIKICDRWNSFENFLSDMGERPKGLTIERKDANGNYDPYNCIWASQKRQANNRTTSRFVTFQGKTKTLKQWSEELKINYPALLARLDKCKWTVEKAFTKPIKKRETP
jgi:hypothetical protein